MTPKSGLVIRQQAITWTNVDEYVARWSYGVIRLEWVKTTIWGNR